MEARFSHTLPDRPCGPPSFLYNGYRVFTGVKRPERDLDHPLPSSAEVKESAFVASSRATVTFTFVPWKMQSNAVKHLPCVHFYFFKGGNNMTNIV